MSGSKLRKLLREVGALLFIIALPLLLLPAGCIAVWVWVAIFPPKPVFDFTVLNRGERAVVRGHLEGDSLSRPVGGIRPGRATRFSFVGCTGRPDANYRLHLVRTDSSRVTIEIGWITGDWDASSLSHAAVVIPTDTTSMIPANMTAWEENALMDSLRKRSILDEDVR